MICAQLRGSISPISNAKERCLTRSTDITVRRPYHALCINSVFLGSVKVNAPNGILNVQLVLEAIWNRLWASYNEQVVGNFLGIGRPWTHARVRQELVFVIARPVRPRAREVRVTLAGLFPSELQKGSQCTFHLVCDVRSKDHSPPSLGQILLVYVFSGPKILFTSIGPLFLQLRHFLWVESFAGSQLGHLPRR